MDLLEATEQTYRNMLEMYSECGRHAEAKQALKELVWVMRVRKEYDEIEKLERLARGEDDPG